MRRICLKDCWGAASWAGVPTPRRSSRGGGSRAAIARSPALGPAEGRGRRHRGTIRIQVCVPGVFQTGDQFDVTGCCPQGGGLNALALGRGGELTPLLLQLRTGALLAVEAVLLQPLSLIPGQQRRTAGRFVIEAGHLIGGKNEVSTQEQHYMGQGHGRPPVRASLS